MLIRYSALDEPDSKRPLDYARPQQSRRPVRTWRLLSGISCFIISFIGLGSARGNVDALQLMPRPGPGSEVSSQERQWQARGERRFFLGCCSGVPIGLIGLILFITAFTGPVQKFGESAAE